MRKKSVDLVIDTLGVGGAERICVNYANYLSNQGYEVRIIIFFQVEQNYMHALDANVRVIELNCKNSFGMFRCLREKKIKLQRTVVAFNHQIAIALWLFKKLCSHKKFRLVARNVNYLSQDLFSRKPSIKKYLTVVLVKLVYRNMDSYIAQCQKMKNDMTTFLRVPESRIQVIYNPVSEKIFHIEKMRKEIDILFVGRLSRQKGIEYLIEIICETSQKLGRDFTVCIIGDGDLKEELSNSLNNIISKSNFKVTLLMFDKVENINRFYNKSKVLILTSRYEGYPNVLVESLVAKTPVISFDCNSGPSEIIDDGVNGFLIPMFDTDYFIERLINVLEGYRFKDVGCKNGKDSLLKLKTLMSDDEI